jgi:hypothetical protein
MAWWLIKHRDNLTLTSGEVTSLWVNVAANRDSPTFNESLPQLKTKQARYVEGNIVVYSSNVYTSSAIVAIW